MKNIFVLGVITVMVIMCSSVVLAEEDASVGVFVGVEDDDPDVWGDPMNETEESEWYGGIGRGEPDADAIEAAGGDDTGEYN
ncbi:MAG: hypothetical protein WBD00_02240 [Candidatus Omnitrophota bacterium]